MDEKINKPEFETRYCNVTMRAALSEEKKPVITGTAAVYDTETVIADFFREKIERGAFDRVLSEKPDVIGAPNHDWTQVLGRTTAGTLRLVPTSRGLDYEIDINPEDQDAMNLYARVKRGDVFQSSFAFTVREEQYIQPEKGKRELPLRVVKEVEKLFDVSPVTFPAYPQTTAAVRSRFGNLADNGSESETTDQAASGGAEDSKEQAKARAESRRRLLELNNLSTPEK